LSVFREITGNLHGEDGDGGRFEQSSCRGAGIRTDPNMSSSLSSGDGVEAGRVGDESESIVRPKSRTGTGDGNGCEDVC
jgi:hypothetical protein